MLLLLLLEESIRGRIVCCWMEVEIRIYSYHCTISHHKPHEDGI
jgi:hypothetical protein